MFANARHVTWEIIHFAPENISTLFLFRSLCLSDLRRFILRSVTIVIHHNRISVTSSMYHNYFQFICAFWCLCVCGKRKLKWEWKTSQTMDYALLLFALTFAWRAISVFRIVISHTIKTKRWNTCDFVAVLFLSFFFCHISIPSHSPSTSSILATDVMALLHPNEIQIRQ